MKGRLVSQDAMYMKVMQFTFYNENKYIYIIVNLNSIIYFYRSLIYIFK